MRSLPCLLSASILCAAAALPAADLVRGASGTPSQADFAAAWGVDKADWPSRFARSGDLRLDQIGGSAPANLVHPGDRPTVTVQLRNFAAQPLAVRGRWMLVEYVLVTRSTDVFDLGLRKLGETTLGAVDVDLAADGFADVEVAIDLPERFAAFALVLEREGCHRLFAASLARTMKPGLAPGERFHQVTMDLDDPLAISRLGTAPNRIGIPYTPTSSKEAAKEYARWSEHLRGIHGTGFPVCVEFGMGAPNGDYLPLGRSRPHLDGDGVMLDTKQDHAWLPAYDEDFKQLVKRYAIEFGWPKGPVNAMKFMNEPWNGMSISGWGADDLRYREIYAKLCEAVEEARAEAGVQILLGGCDSSSNTFDKLFPDGDLSFLPRLDFMSLHYQGLAPSNARFMRDRQGPNGRVLFWDTESWVANSQDRVPGVLAGMLAAGHDRIVGIQSHGVVATPSKVEVRLADGKSERRTVIHAWPVAPAQVAFNTVVGNRPFKDLVFGQALPWVFRFQGKAADDLALVITGDLSPALDSNNQIGVVPLRSVRGLAELKEKAELRARLAALPADAPERADLQKRLAARVDLSGGRMSVPADPRWSLLDGSGNAISARDGRLEIPLDGSGWYLRPDGSPGSGEALLAAVRTARIDGYEPLATEVRDALAPIGAKPVFRVELRNILNRPVSGRLAITLGKLQVEAPASLSFAAHEAKMIEVRVTGGEPDPGNLYQLSLRFDAGADGVAEHDEQVRVNQIHKRRITVDGDLAEWAGALPQSVAQGGGGPTLMETAWLPMVKHDKPLAKGFVTAWLAADDEGFAIAAKVADDTPDPGMRRWATADWSDVFYPEVSYQIDPARTRIAKVRAVKADGSVSASVWEPVSRQMSFSLDLPGERMVSLLFVDDDGLLRRLADITVTDAAGKRLAAASVRDQRGVWLRLRLSGSVAVTVGNNHWLRPTLAAVAVDPLPADAPVRSVLGEDRASAGRLDGYGGELLLLPGQPAKGAIPARWSEDIARTEMRWPDGIRRFSYRRRPDLVHGSSNDNLQIAFNVLPDEAKPWYPMAPGTFKGFAGYWCTDYEFALNPIAERFGGGYEVWPLSQPGKPKKHFYPRQPPFPGEGPVAGAQLVVKRDGATRIIEAKIPWSAIPEVKLAREAGRPIKFSYRANDNAGAGCLELSRDRSVAKRGLSFHPDWVEHWTNEVEFGWER